MANVPKFISRLLRQRWLQITLLAFAILITATVLYIRHQINQLPEWWQPADATSTETIKQGASTENLVITEMNRITGRPDGTEWTLKLTEAEMNAWLATRLPQWAANQFPGSFIATGVAETHLRLEKGVIRFGTLVDFNPPPNGIINSKNSQSLSITLEPSIDSSGQLHLTLTAATIGQFPVPVQTVVGKALDHFKLPNQDLHDLIRGHPVIPLVTQGKSRRMILTSITVETGLLILEWRTEVGKRRNTAGNDRDGG